MSITVSTQAELDQAITDGEPVVYVESDPSVWLNLPTSGISHVVARGNTRVLVRGESCAVAWDDAHVMVWGESHVDAFDHSHVDAFDHSRVEAWDNSHVEARDTSHVQALLRSHVVATECTTVYIHSPQVHVESTGTVVDMIGEAESPEMTNPATEAADTDPLPNTHVIDQAMEHPNPRRVESAEELNDLPLPNASTINAPIIVPCVWRHIEKRWPTSTAFKQVAKVGEEAGEAIGAAIKHDEGRKTEQHVRDELADTIIAAIGALQARGADAAETVLDRWVEVSKR
jgi:NTP pyrophosphatase (non-canonical NTP hydrolase)